MPAGTASADAGPALQGWRARKRVLGELPRSGWCLPAPDGCASRRTGVLKGVNGILAGKRAKTTQGYRDLRISDILTNF